MCMRKFMTLVLACAMLSTPVNNHHHMGEAYASHHHANNVRRHHHRIIRSDNHRDYSISDGFSEAEKEGTKSDREDASIIRSYKTPVAYPDVSGTWVLNSAGRTHWPYDRFQSTICGGTYDVEPTAKAAND